MQQFGMMHQLILIFIDGFFLYYVARAFVRKVGQNSKSKKFILIGIIAALLLSSHFALYNYFVKSENYLEFYQLQRAYSSEKLFKKARQVLSLNHPDKNPNVTQDEFSEIMMKRNILADQQYQKLYDRFGEFKFDEQTKAKDYSQTKTSLALNGYINTLSFYAVFFIVNVVLSYGQKYSKYRILSILILIGLALQDLIFFSEIDDEYDTTKSNQRNPKFDVARDFYDDYFPTYTIFERLQLIRILCAALLTSLRLFFDCLIDERINKYEDSLDQNLDEFYAKLMKQKEEQKDRKLDEKSLKDNQEALLKIKELAFKHKEEGPKERFKFIKKLFKIAVFCLMIYLVMEALFEDKSDNSKTQKTQTQQNNQQHQHHHHHHDHDHDHNHNHNDDF